MEMIAREDFEPFRNEEISAIYVVHVYWDIFFLEYCRDIFLTDN
jgi:hypothetical protein